MKKRLMLISLILAMLAATLVFAYLQSLQKPKEQVKKVKVLVASMSIQARTQITAKMINTIEVPDSALVKDYIKDSKMVVGKYAKSTIEKDEGFLASKLIDKDASTDEITIKIEKNHRAVSISATGNTGVAKLIKPGDFVDIYVYLSEKSQGQGQVSEPSLTKVLLQNLKVLAIDRRLVRDSNVADDAKDTSGGFLVTLSVPVDDVGKLVLAEDIGSLKLALRPAEKEKPYVPKTITADELYAMNAKSGKTATPSPKSSGTVKSTPKPTATPKPTMTQKPVQTATPGNTPKTTNTSGNVTKNYKLYTVKPGDTLMSLSRKFYNNNEDYVLIMKANHIDDKNLLETGTRLRIPIKSH